MSRALPFPAPAGEAELREWAGEYFSRRLDRARPLWEIVVLELGDGRWAMVSKTHHCMVDGVGSVDIGQTILDPQPDTARRATDDRPHRHKPPAAARPRSLGRQLAQVPVEAGVRLSASGPVPRARPRTSSAPASTSSLTPAAGGRRCVTPAP